jgi:hypothetical protein
MSPSRLALLSAVLAFSVCGCELDKPLSDPAKAQVDERLLGRWVGVATKLNPDAGDGLLFIGRHRIEQNPDGIMEALAIDYNLKDQTIGDADTTRVTYFSVTKIGSLEMLDLFFDDDRLAELSEKNSYARWAASKKRSSLLMRYKLEGDQLKLVPVDSVKIDELAKAGKLMKSADDDDLVTAESLKSYIEANGGEDLFDETNDVAVYKRLK